MLNKFIVLYQDNCPSHLFAPSMSSKMQIRNLIPNATHIQQPVDQHIGLFFQNHLKKKFWQYKEKLLDDIENGERDKNEKDGRKIMRHNLIKWTTEAIIMLKNNDKLIKRSWINFGSELPDNGSDDADISTIVN